MTVYHQPITNGSPIHHRRSLPATNPAANISTIHRGRSSCIARISQIYPQSTTNPSLAITVYHQSVTNLSPSGYQSITNRSTIRRRLALPATNPVADLTTIHRCRSPAIARLSLIYNQSNNNHQSIAVYHCRSPIYRQSITIPQPIEHCLSPIHHWLLLSVDNLSPIDHQSIPAHHQSKMNISPIYRQSITVYYEPIANLAPIHQCLSL